MKRLISWLLALTLVFGLLPLSAFAAVDVESGESDFDVDFGELTKPEIPELAMGDNAIEIPAGNMNGVEYAFTAPTAGSYVLSFGLTSILQPEFDENYEPVIDETTGEQATYWEDVPPQFAASALRQYASIYVNETLISNVDSVYELAAGDKLAIKIYSNMLNANYKMNINVAAALVDGNNEISLVAGPSGNTFKYIATQDGDLVIKPVAMSTYEYDMSSEEPVLTEVPAEYVENVFGRNFSVDMDATSVEAGQVVTIVITGMSAAEVTLNVSIVEPAPEGSTIDNPGFLGYTETENLYTATVPAKSTYYFYCNGDYTVNVEGAAFEVIDGYILAITNDTDAEVVYNVTQVPPVGYDTNPAVIEEMDGYSSTIDLPDGGEYFYTYTAEADGTVSLTITDGVNVTVNDETFKYDLMGELVSEVVTIEVAEGDVLNIKINILENENWERPATTYTLTGDFEPAVKCDHDAVAKGAQCEICGKLKISGVTCGLGNSLAFNFVFDTAKLSGTDNYAVVTKYFADGTESSITVEQKDWPKYSGNLKYVPYNGVASTQMTDEFVIRIYNAAGEEVTIEYRESIRDYLMRMLIAEENKATPRDYIMTLYVDMMNYGAAAQDYFNDYKMDDLANSQLTDAQQAYATKELVGSDCRVQGEGYAGGTLTCENEIILNFVFRNATIDQAEYAVVSYKDHKGASQQFTVDKSEFGTYNSSMKYVAVKGMSIAACGEPMTVVLYDSNDNAISTNVDSAVSYCFRNQTKDMFIMIWRFAISSYNYATH